MTPTGNAFTEHAADLYRDGSRLAARTSALHRAKTHGRPVADVIAELAANRLAVPQHAVVADIGCGRGTSSRVLAERLGPQLLLCVDASAAMLSAARARISARTRGTHTTVVFLRADFHHMPLPDAACDLAVAAFCLYHAADPRPVIDEIARTLAPCGAAILVTKSADSYRALDCLVADAGLDVHATERPSLYAAAHSGNLADLTAPFLQVERVQHEEHRFAFTGLDHVADYLATSPKYDLPPGLAADPAAIAAALHAVLPDRPLVTTSTITYLTATRGAPA
ncbi:class I SAM-dependent methyltransferase [Nonomuraea sediminis]|uniref:class I SAM-dependent methyltransferase n=1 Tax=Nonomuraea sediminis TaxID=2835864 RepID=UPI001BDBC3E5|nr:class I SAM-dependent methyltransferase [Nonomuraea sediminis]